MTSTFTPTGTWFSSTPTLTWTPTDTLTPSWTVTNTHTPANTHTPTNSPTNTLSDTPTFSPHPQPNLYRHLVYFHSDQFADSRSAVHFPDYHQ